MSIEKTRVAVVDDHQITRSFLENIIEAAEGYELSGSYPLAGDCVRSLESDPCDLVIMDIMMRKGIDGLTAARMIKEKRPKTKIIMVTSMAESRWIDEAESIGVEAFWFKEYSAEPLLRIMDRVMKGETVYRDDTREVMIGEARKEELTDRELDVLRELTTCATNEQISEDLHISVNTVKTHIRHMLEKTGFTDRLELAINASKSGIVVSDRERKSGDI